MLALHSFTLDLRFALGLAVLLAGLLGTSPVGAQSDSTSTGTLTVHVDGPDSDKGTVRIALNDERNYDAGGNVRAASLPIEDGTARWTVEKVLHGTYAVRLYHDENDNGELDTNMFGAPQEAFGFSNNARGSLGPPDFEEAAFTIDSDSLTMTITAE